MLIMKRLYLIITCCIVPLFAMADFVNKKVNENIKADDVTSLFAAWFHTNDCSFELYDDKTDEIGMRHQAYQQYYNGVAVENCILIVHSKNGIVTYINGDIMPVKSQPTNPVQISRKKAMRIANANSVNDDEMEQTIIHLQTKDGDKFYNAYKISDKTEDIYVDVQTGEVLKRVSRIQQSTVCNGTTLFSGARTFDAEVSSSTGNYITYNWDRNIHVCYALMDFTTNKYTDSYYFSNSTTNWDNTYLTSVTIESVNNKWWSNFLDSEDYPNLYIKITDANDNVLYRSDYKDMSYTTQNKYPVTFNIGKMIKVPVGGGYKLKIYDQDSLDDDLGMTITLNSNSLGTYSWGQSSSNVKGSFEITAWHPAIDVIWGLQQVYDYYMNVFSRFSFDDDFSPLYAIIHNPTTGTLKEEVVRYSNDEDYPYLNAFAYSGKNVNEAFMYFGLGNEKYFPFVEFNIVSHEYTHLVINYRSLGDLEYKGESGALNESIADIMAKNIEHYFNPNTFSWQLSVGLQGEGTYLRDFQKPWKKGQPSCYDGGWYWVDPQSEDDHGGVHTNSGVSNHWYYILCDGKEGTNEKGYEYNVTGIGIEKAQRIIFRTLINYLPQQATFLQARDLSIQAAEDLYGENSDEVHAVDEAWKAVGVGEMKNALKPGKYLIYTHRNNDYKCWYMSSDLGTASTKRFQADTISDKSSYYMLDADETFLWDLAMNEDGTYTIKNGDKYISWISGNSAALSNSPVNLNIDNDLSTGTYKVSITTNSSSRYLSLNSTEGNNFFAFYGNTNQCCDLYFESFEQYEPYTIRAKMPSNWQQDIKAFVFRPEEEDKGKVITPVYEDGWYSYALAGNYYIYFINGNSYADSNLSEPILIREDCCVRIGSESTGKHSYAYMPCDEVLTCEPVKETWLQTGGSGLGEITTDNTSVWRYDSSYGAKASKSGGAIGNLFTPARDLSGSASVTLSFSHTHKYAGVPSEELTLYVTPDYQGNFDDSQWYPLQITPYAANTNWTFVDVSVNVPIYYLGENTVFCFTYFSTDTNYATWEIKNLSLTATCDEGMPTEYESINCASQPQKIIDNSHLYIVLPDGSRYTVTGVKVE